MRELQKRSAHIPDDHLLVWVGDMITEEALPTYMTMLNTLDGTRDETGASETAWASWTRKWTAEENRHGDAMNKCAPLRAPHTRRRPGTACARARAVNSGQGSRGGAHAGTCG